MKSESIVVDLDDFCTANAPVALAYLDELYRRSDGRFKVTLFTIPGLTTPDVYGECQKRPWIELGAHGWQHTDRECEGWTDAQMENYINTVYKTAAYIPLFKPPFWLASSDVYRGLLRHQWILADHPSNRHKIPADIRQYILSPIHTIGHPHLLMPLIQAHGHIQNVEGNGLIERFEDFDALKNLDLPYQFVSEVAL